MNKIVWALDPFSHLGKSIRVISQAIASFAKPSQAQVIPVYVLSPSTINWTGDFSGNWEGEFERFAQTGMKKVLAQVELPNATEPVVIVNPEASTELAARRLLDYCDKENADVIAISTHAREGIKRWILGSFAETMLLTSKRPLLTINPDVKKIEAFEKILFPTDFSRVSKAVLKRSAPTLKQFNAEMTLYHKIPDLLDPIVQSGVLVTGGGWVSTSEFFEHRYKRAEEQMQEMVALAKELGLSAKTEIYDGPNSVVDAIYNYVDEQGVDLVAVGSRSGPVESIIYGSIGRGLVRHLQVPVWAVHENE